MKIIHSESPFSYLVSLGSDNESYVARPGVFGGEGGKYVGKGFPKISSIIIGLLRKGGLILCCISVAEERK